MRNPLPARAWIAMGVEALVFALLLFGAAGTLMWPAAWVFIILLFAEGLIITVALARDDPALLAERLKLPLQKGQPLWDRIFVVAIGILFLGWLALMGLDAGRFGWSRTPLWAQALGAVGLTGGMWFCHRVFRENTFAAAVVRIQAERRHKVISTGPYAIVRHPLYAGALVVLPSMALMLGSLWGLAATVVLAAALVARTALEDRELRLGLDGYAAYAARVRYRLIPFIW